jgi:hypothetical protein
MAGVFCQKDRFKTNRMVGYAAGKKKVFWKKKDVCQVLS